MKTAQVRKAFLDYFRSKGHEIVPSSSLVPDNDPTLLFSNAGMNQFKDLFLGNEKRSYSRAASCQKCLRISGKHNDLENVGRTARHHTFFEMLGNFSFGDYFKREAIEYGWDFVTNVLKLPKSRLWATVYEEDDEAAKLWAEITDINPARILRMGEKDNFWAMGETGPCGPCSEIFYYLGEDESAQSEEEFRKDDGTYIEIWNLVFMQFERAADGTMTPLPKPSVDTGMGLERAALVMQGVKATYDTDILRGIISVCEELSSYKYDGSSYELKDLRKDKAYARDVAMRVIADHSRAIAFLIADGVTPSSDGRGYVLRRLIRRAVRHGQALDLREPFLARTTEAVVKLMSDQYQELSDNRELITRLVEAEETKFHETLESGLAVLNREAEKCKKGSLFSGEVAFLLHDTYGFPLDLTQDALKAYGLEVDVEAFNRAMEKQKERSREDRKRRGIEFVSVAVDDLKPTEFVGYDTLETEARLCRILEPEGNNTEIQLVFDATPFYAEAGGQVGDTGEIHIKDVKLRVIDTQKVQDKYYLHRCEVLEGSLSDKLIGEKGELRVDAERRRRIMSNHSATHLVHAALRKFLGTHVKQAGSRVDDNTLRFDYSHFEPVSASQLDEMQSWVNEYIRANHEVETKVLPIEEAKKTGAIALFGEKYGDLVRVVQIGPDSIEFCGGTHVSRSGDIGLMFVQSETGISAGARRIECWAGPAAFEELLKEKRERLAIGELLKSDLNDLPAKIEKLLQRNRDLEKALDKARARLASAKSGDLVESARTTPSGIKVIVEKVEGADSDTLRSMVDSLRVKLGSGVVALASEQNGTGVIVAGVTPDLTKKVHAGVLVKEAASACGGRGGGRPDFAQAGGVNPAMLNQTLDKFFELIS
ncbi:MAG: alanine--tRNA ligase [Candidatus Dadabacteria bacterium]|nr:MAG: alanine--tRNA ligase [Candidatus Dadabacteria bacterium]